MKKLPKLSRRSFLGTVAGAAAGSVLVAPGEAQALQSGCSDSDPSPPRGDASGRGRRCTPVRRTGCSDSDSGRGSDPSGGGVRCNPNACSDSDSGRGSDPSGRGRRCGNQQIATRGACSRCSCTEYVQGNTAGALCARENCGHGYLQHQANECRPGNVC